MTIEINEEIADIRKAYNHIRNLQNTISLSDDNASLESAGYELEKVLNQLEDYIEEQHKEHTELYNAICEENRKAKEKRRGTNE